MSFVLTSVEELVNKAMAEGKNISEIVIQWEVEHSKKTREEILSKMARNWEVMKNSIDEGLKKKGTTMGGLVKEAAKTFSKKMDNNVLPDDRLARTVAKALATAEVNASMGRVVAAPTGGSCGIIPAVLATAQEDFNLNDEDIIASLFTAAGIGVVIAEKASVSGAEGGCQAECGSAAAMAASALVELRGGSPEQVANAAALSLKNSLGLVCDPVRGLVEIPCIKRNAFLAVNALVAADMTLAGITSFIPVDEVITAMAEIGRDMPEKYRETAKGGLAVTPTAIRSALDEKQ